MGKVCSVVRSEEDDNVMCEFEPLLRANQLPDYLLTPERQQPTHGATEQLFVVEFEWDKPLIALLDIMRIFEGIQSIHSFY